MTCISGLITECSVSQIYMWKPLLSNDVGPSLTDKNHYTETWNTEYWKDTLVTKTLNISPQDDTQGTT